MKLLINDKRRNIYFRKDNSAYYKSGGSENDVTSMFKKTGGGLKKQFSNLLIEGDEKSANMLGGKPKSLKNKLVGGAPTIKKVFDFLPISVTYNPNIPDNASPEDLKALSNELKKTHRVLLLLSILKTLDHSPKGETADFDSLDNAYKSFDVTNIKNSIIKNLDSINTELDTTDREKLIESYKKLEDVMGILTSKDAAAAEPGGGVGG